jgi:gliding motility-associated-like protein
MKSNLYYILFLLFFLKIDVAFSQGLTCGEAEPFCAGDTTLIFPNTTVGFAEAGPDYGCLGSQPNPAWYFIQIDQPGNLNFNIVQNTLADLSGTGLDVDFIAYGPFTNTNVCDGATLTAGNTIACSFSAAPVENFTISNALAGEIYVLLITNFDGSAGFIQLQQTNAGGANAGATDCSIVNTTNLCEGDNISLDATTNNAVVYEWAKDGVLMPTETGPILNNVLAPSATYTATAFDNGGGILLDFEFIVVFHSVPIAFLASDMMQCDDNNDGFFNFDLTTQNAQILGVQNATLFNVTYYISQADSDLGINALLSPYTNTSNPQTIFARIENNDNIDCFNTTSFLIEVFDNPTANQPLDFVLCDNMDDGDNTNGVVTFDLTTKIIEVLGTQLTADFEVKFYYTQVDADAGILGTEITTPIQNTSNPQPIFARIENRLNTSCYNTTTFNLVVNPLPVVTAIVELTQCDNDTDGFTDFNLTEANVLISNDAVNETFTYYLTNAQAQVGLIADQIINFINYTNPVALNSSVYARVETNNGCFRISRIDLVVGATQIPIAFNLNYEICDDKLIDNNNTNGIATFDFSNATTQVEALFPVGQNLTITYYTNETDALAETNAIADISNHRNDVSPNTQNIYIRVDSDVVNACLGLGSHIILTVNPLPIVNPIADYVLCSDTNEAVFDLFTKDQEVIGAQTDPIIVSYHLSDQDAINNIPIATATAYTNTSNPQTIYIRAQFDKNGNGLVDIDDCVSTDMFFELVVNLNPTVFTPDTIRVCSNQLDTLYDLTIREDQITGGDNLIVLTYFESQLDIDNNTPIVDPTMYTNTLLDRDILVLATGTNLCTSTVVLPLKTILYANLNITPAAIEECEVDNNGFDFFDITRREIEILNGLSSADFTFTYYEDETDAILGNTNIITNILSFENTQINTQTIYVRVLPVANECFVLVPLTLVVNPVPEIAIEDQYVICLDNNQAVINPITDTFLPVPPIDTQLSESEYTFQWYNGTEAEVNADPISVIIIGATSSSFSPTVAGDYTVIATNIATGCRIPASTVVVGSYPPESISVELLSTAFSSNNILEVTVVGIGEYEFRLDFGPWQSSNIFEQVIGGEHIIYVRDLLNCNEISEIQIVIDYPKYFTPNDDGYHDTWNILGIATQPNSIIYIFDRYGKLLKQLSPLSLGWDGTFNGSKLPSSDYWFTVEYVEPSDGIIKIFKAHFSLKR